MFTTEDQSPVMKLQLTSILLNSGCLNPTLLEVQEPS